MNGSPLLRSLHTDTYGAVVRDAFFGGIGQVCPLPWGGKRKRESLEPFPSVFHKVMIPLAGTTGTHCC